MRYDYGLLAILSLAMLVAATAAAGYGTSMITLGTYNMSVTQGGSQAVAYKVNLSSGGTWGSIVNVINSAQLSSEGVTVTLSTPGGEPPFSGMATVRTGSGTAPGSYKVMLNVTGDDHSINTATLNLSVLAPAGSSSTGTTVQTTAPPTSPTTIVTSTAQPTTVTSVYPNGYGSGSGSAAYAAVGIVIAIIVVALVIVLAKRK